MKKITLASLITLIISLTFIFSACSGGNNNQPVKEKTINGVNYSDCAIVYSAAANDYTKRAAEYIKNAMTVGDTAPKLVTDAASCDAKYFIVVGETEMDISKKLDEETAGVEFAVLAEGNEIALEANYFVIAAAAYYFVETYIANTDDATVAATREVRTPITKEAKNFILLIGDGMGQSHTKLPGVIDADCPYSDGEDIFYGYLLPNEGRASTNSLSGVTDSAASATALATGYKTANKTIGQDAYGNNLRSLTELALSLGKSAAVMSTEKSTGATPSAFSAHTDNRNNTSDIQDQQDILQYDKGVIIECNYNQYDVGGVKYIRKTINTTLDTLAKNDKGFFLMYEEAYIDKHAANNDIVNTYLALMRFNQAIACFMEFAFYNPETMVIITADHETGGLTPNGSGFSFTTEDHTGAEVPVFAYGEGSEIFNNKNYENTEISQTIAYFWGITDFGDTASFKPLQIK